MTSKTAYVLTKGEYSDYCIIGVYSTKELAEEAQTLWPYSDVESFSLDHIPDHPPGTYFWLGCVEERIDSEEPGQEVYKADPSDPSWQGTEFIYGNLIRFHVHFWATDEDHAYKILHDKYHQHKAQKLGLV